MEENLEAIAALVVAYLLGSVEFAVIVARRMGIDIYAHGSGNPGTSNVLRTLGKKAAGLVLAGDALKGIVATAIGSWWGGEVVGFAAAFFATVGHSFPVWHRFRGGRGVATAIGGAIWLEPIWGLALAAGWLAIVVSTKTASIASLGAMALYVPVFLIAGHRGWAILWAALTAGLVIWRHKDNIKRILTRAEHRVTT